MKGLGISASQRQRTRADLHETLHRLEYAAFEQVMKRLLYKSGYLSVHLIGRNHRPDLKPKGGLDLSARSMTELTSVLTIAQVKQYRGAVPRRFVDELRGAMLRLGAEQGLLLTLSRFSLAARAAAIESSLAPVKLIEGEEVLDLLFAYRIGVCEENGIWRLDREWLDSLQKNAIALYGQKTKKLPSRLQRSPTTQSLTPPCNEAILSVNNGHESSLQTQPHNLPHERSGMTWSTHVMVGISSLWLLELFPQTPPENLALLAGAATLGSLLPDLDAPRSKIQHLTIAGIKPFQLPARMIYRQLGHRSMLHSLMGLVGIAIIEIMISPFIGYQASLALWLGYACHLIADSSTPAGIPLLYPRMRRFHLFPKRFCIVTGSLAEDVVFALLSLSVLFLLLRHLVILSA